MLSEVPSVQLLKQRLYAKLRSLPGIAKSLSSTEASMIACRSFDGLIFYLGLGAQLKVAPHCKLNPTIAVFQTNSPARDLFIALATDNPQLLPTPLPQVIPLGSITLFTKDLCFALQAHTCELFIPTTFPQMTHSPDELLLHLLTQQPAAGYAQVTTEARANSNPSSAGFLSHHRLRQGRSRISKIFNETQKLCRQHTIKYPKLCLPAYRKQLMQHLLKQCGLKPPPPFEQMPAALTQMRQARAPRPQPCSVAFLGKRFLDFAMGEPVSPSSCFPTDVPQAHLQHPIFEYLVATSIACLKQRNADACAYQELMSLFAALESEGTLQGEPTYSRCSNLQLITRLTAFINENAPSPPALRSSALTTLSRSISLAFFNQLSDNKWEVFSLCLKAFIGEAIDISIRTEWRALLLSELKTLFPNPEVDTIKTHVKMYVEKPILISPLLEKFYANFFRKYVDRQPEQAQALFRALHHSPHDSTAKAYLEALKQHMRGNETLAEELIGEGAALHPSPEIMELILKGASQFDYGVEITGLSMEASRRYTVSV